MTGLSALSVDIDLGQAVPGDWVAEQLDFMLAWEKEKLVAGLL